MLSSFERTDFTLPGLLACDFLTTLVREYKVKTITYNNLEILIMQLVDFLATDMRSEKVFNLKYLLEQLPSLEYDIRTSPTGDILKKAIEDSLRELLKEPKSMWEMTREDIQRKEESVNSIILLYTSAIITELEMADVITDTSLNVTKQTDKVFAIRDLTDKGTNGKSRFGLTINKDTVYEGNDIDYKLKSISPDFEEIMIELHGDEKVDISLNQIWPVSYLMMKYLSGETFLDRLDDAIIEAIKELGLPDD